MRLPPSSTEGDNSNLTPLIDVVFLLLIFFLVTTQFAQEEQEEYELPTSLPPVPVAVPRTEVPRALVVNIDNKGKYIVSGEEYSEEALAGLLKEVATNNPHYTKLRSVLIRADKRVPVVFPARVMSLCLREDFKHVLAVEKEPE
ncbi:MAG: biopolymer transporter ExbD [Candidatus Nealsonbacteria bacterium]|nr:biopolymer transporter ExbD [Candidatus Nealsonbacteria bacterium]